jgi:hypothetical protein
MGERGEKEEKQELANHEKRGTHEKGKQGTGMDEEQKSGNHERREIRERGKQ